jgi:hypothetical protein
MGTSSRGDTSIAGGHAPHAFACVRISLSALRATLSDAHLRITSTARNGVGVRIVVISAGDWQLSFLGTKKAEVAQ